MSKPGLTGLVEPGLLNPEIPFPILATILICSVQDNLLRLYTVPRSHELGQQTHH